MSRLSKRHVAILVVGLAVVLAGCSGGGGGGGDGGTGTVTETPTETADPGGNGNDGDEATDTATATETMADGGTTTDDGNGGTTTDAGGTATPTKTSQGTPTDGGPNADSHGASLREAGSYTLRVELTSLSTTSRGGTVTDVSTTTISGTQKTLVGTGERYGKWSFSTGSGTIEYYVPPKSDTAYQHFNGKTRQISADQALFLNFTRITDPSSQTSSQLVTNFSAYGQSGSGTTPLGPATKYVIDDPSQLPDSAFSRVDTIKSVNMALWVDKDTGIIAKYQYKYTAAIAGQEVTLEGVIAIENVGSTTVKKPDWVPK